MKIECITIDESVGRKAAPTASGVRGEQGGDKRSDKLDSRVLRPLITA